MVQSQTPPELSLLTYLPVSSLFNIQFLLLLISCINRLVVMDKVRDLASKKAAVIFTKSSCYMCYSIKTLFYELGASPAIHELDHDPNGRDMERALRGLGCDPSVPAVFIGGRFVGSAKDVISLHVDGSLKQMLKDAKAIWF
ncbi:Glutaredoxin-C11 [Hibiscus syriacus]|uniref:Glutaredoxin-C11 n=2 Tax=Hibiscus TaxID=47605 RepID=A0A6A2ZPS4_HIBSY|nr:glutaredoxin-C11-like [Hibiscus syriacus]KAE8693750.1 Glutaredoxin-C11 [Hibiscus syriacus]